MFCFFFGFRERDRKKDSRVLGLIFDFALYKFQEKKSIKELLSVFFILEFRFLSFFKKHGFRLKIRGLVSSSSRFVERSSGIRSRFAASVWEFQLNILSWTHSLYNFVQFSYYSC